MANKDLLLDRHKVKRPGFPDYTTAEEWWYETPSGISVFAWRKGMQATEVKIPWRSIRAALKRKDR